MMGTISDQSDLPDASLAVPQNVYAMVEDHNVAPIVANRVSLARIADFPPTNLTPASPTTLSGNEGYEILVNSVNVANTVTVPTLQSARIQNVSQTGINLVVITSGNPQKTVAPGEMLTVIYNGIDHDITLSAGGGGSITVDNAMSDVSANPVENQVVKAYIDALPGQTVDTAMSAASTNPVQNKIIKAYHDLRGYVRSGDYVISQSSGTLATRITTDDAAWNEAISAITTAGKGRIWIDGEVTLNALKYVPGYCSLRGINSEAALRITHANAQLNFGSFWDALATLTGEAALTLTATSAFQERITVAGATYAEGDWVAVYSNDELTGMLKNLTFQKPLEVHQIMRDEGSNVYHLNDFIVDALTSTPKCRRIPMVYQPGSKTTDLVIADLKLRQEAGVLNDRLIDIRCVNGVTIENVVWELDGSAGAPGYIDFHYCANVRFLGNQNEGTEQYDIAGQGYFCEIGAVNGFIAQHNFSRRCRHSFDTTSSSQGGTANTRWGTPRNVKICDNVVHVEGNPSGVGTLIAMSTHGEGWGIEFTGNQVIISENGGFTNSAFTVRSRACKIVNNHIFGGGLNYGVQSFADDTEVINNCFERGWQNIVNNDSYYSTYGQFNRLQVKNNTFRNCQGGTGTVLLENGDDIVLEDNTFIDCVCGGIYIDPGLGTLSKLRILSNKFIRSPSSGAQTTIRSTGTVAGVRVHGNYFDTCLNECINFVGIGSNNIVSSNTFIDCSTSKALVKFAGDGTTTGLRVSNNDATNGLNTYLCDVGSLGTGASVIVFRGNTADGYGASSLGLTGTNATTINTNNYAKNWVD